MRVSPITASRTYSNLIFTSGQIGARDDGTVPDKFGEEVRLAIERLAEVLDKAQSSLGDVIKVTAFVTDLALIAEMNTVYAEMLGAHFPARSTLVVSLAAPHIRFEIEAIATVRNDVTLIE